MGARLISATGTKETSFGGRPQDTLSVDGKSQRWPRTHVFGWRQVTKRAGPGLWDKREGGGGGLEEGGRGFVPRGTSPAEPQQPNCHIRTAATCRCRHVDLLEQNTLFLRM